MITVTIEINEIKEGVVTMAQKYRIQNKTEAEHKLGRCLDFALKHCLNFISEQANSGEAIEGEDIEMEAKLAMLRAFKSQKIEGQGLKFK